MEGIVGTYVLPCLWAFVACMGFGLVFNIRGFGLLICGLGAGLGWLVYLVAMAQGTGDIAAAFVAAIAIGAYSEIMARVRRCPVTGYLQVALLPLDLFLATLLHTLGMAAALSVGAMLVSSVLRILRRRREERESKE